MCSIHTVERDIFKLIEKKQETTHSARQACFVVSHSSVAVLINIFLFTSYLFAKGDYKLCRGVNLQFFVLLFLKDMGSVLFFDGGAWLSATC